VLFDFITPNTGSLDTTVRLKYPLATYPSLTTPTALTGLLASFGAVDTSTVVLSMKPSKKAPGKPPKYATALIPFTSIAAAFAAVGASGRADRGVQGVEITWAGGSEPTLIGWLKKKGMLSSGDVQASAKGKPPPPPSASMGSAATTDTSFSSFPTSFVSPCDPCSVFSGADVTFLLQPTAVPPADSIPGVDFESLTLMRMRQAERERLEREIIAQEADDI
jgi:DnaJ family protein C protein 17